jgi:hypothetical protein
MSISPSTDKFLHSKLPIDDDEQVLAVYKHHWFAYASSWFAGIFIGLLIMGVAVSFAMLAGGNSESPLAGHQSQIIGVASLLSVLVLAGTAIPVYLRSQEQVVLTEEALLQVLQPSVFSSKIDQVSLQHIADVSVHQDFFGTMLGFGHITLETPGEQNNYQFSTLPDPHNAAKQIIAAHENFDAALQSGRIKTTMGSAMPQAPQIDPQQYQQFLQYQQMVAQQAQQQGQQAAQANSPVGQPEQQGTQPDDARQ